MLFTLSFLPFIIVQRKFGSKLYLCSRRGWMCPKDSQWNRWVWCLHRWKRLSYRIFGMGRFDSHQGNQTQRTPQRGTWLSISRNSSKRSSRWSWQLAWCWLLPPRTHLWKIPMERKVLEALWEDRNQGQVLIWRFIGCWTWSCWPRWLL